jgi:hypothetical protein
MTCHAVNGKDNSENELKTRETDLIQVCVVGSERDLAAVQDERSFDYDPVNQISLDRSQDILCFYRGYPFSST